MKSTNTLIFDLDGTISDPSLGIFRCTNHALVSHGYSEVSAARVAAEIGPPLDEMFSKFQPEVDESGIASLIGKYRERYSEKGFAENALYPGIAQALRLLKGRGMRMGVCTSKRADFAQRILSMFGLAELFAFIDGGDIGIKKHEQLAGLIRDNKIDRTAVMIGDRSVDIAAAKANGLRSVGVLWGFGNEQELSEADKILRFPDELVGLGN